MNISQNITAKGLKAAAISLLFTGGFFGQGGTVVENHVLPDISLRDFVNHLPGSITNDVYKLAYDNDFGVTANCTDTIATKSRIFVVDLDQPIK